MIIVTYEFGSFLEPQEQEFLVVHDNACMHALHLRFFLSLIEPVNRALNLSLEVCGEPCWNQGHLDVLMGVGLKFARHRLKLKVIAAHQA